MIKIMLCEVYKTVNYPGGVEKCLSSFANEFTNRGYEVTYVCLDTEKGLPFYKLSDSVKFVNLCYFYDKYKSCNYYLTKIEKEIKRFFGGSKMVFMGLPLKDPKKEYFEKEYISRLRRYILSNRPDIIICADSQSLYLAQEASLNQIPTVAMCHLDPASIMENVSLNEINAWKKAKVVQVLVDSFRKDFEKVGINNTVCIPNIVKQIDNNELAVDEKADNNIIFVGRLEKTTKRPDLLLKAFSLIASKYPEWRVKFYGSTDDIKYLKKMKMISKDNKIDNKVFFCGSEKDIFSKMRESKIFVNTSCFEGFPLAVTEAMSIGLPIVGFKECRALNGLIINNNNGFLVDDVQDMADKLSILMDDKNKRVEFGINGHNLMKRYRPDTVWDRWEKLILSIYRNSLR